jgi:hypothetical protein
VPKIFLTPLRIGTIFLGLYFGEKELALSPERSGKTEVSNMANEQQVEEFAKKLDEWANTLPEPQRALLRKLLGRAQKHTFTSGDDSYAIDTSVEQAVVDALGPATGGKEQVDRSWIKGGPIWVRGASSSG